MNEISEHKGIVRKGRMRDWVRGQVARRWCGGVRSDMAAIDRSAPHSFPQCTRREYVRLVLGMAEGTLCNQSAPFANSHDAIADSVLVTFSFIIFIIFCIL